MLFLVRMDVSLPRDLDAGERERLLAEERERALTLQRAGSWRHLWRVVGQYSNYSVFEVDSNAALHDILWSLPLFPFMRVEVVPLTTHPSALDADA